MQQPSKEWAQDIYQKAKVVAEDVISQASGPVPFSVILEAVKTRYPVLCDDSIPDPWIPSWAYWKHRVAHALQTLKRRKIQPSANGWIWIGERTETKKGDAIAGLGAGTPTGVPTLVPVDQEKPNEQSAGDKLKKELMDTLRKLSPKGFQDLIVKNVLPSLGMTNVVVRQFTKDGGIDGEGSLEISEETVIAGLTERSTRLVKCAIQVKRWEPTISRPEIQTFRGAIAGQFDRGLYVTTSDFSKDAYDEARKGGVTPITPISGAALVDILIKKGIGTKEITVTIVDPEFFVSY